MRPTKRKQHVMYALMKRTLDIIIASIGLVILSPLFLVLALVIKIESNGPVLLYSIRVGKGGRVFRVWKFRTMSLEFDIKEEQAYVGKLLSGDLGPKRGNVKQKIKSDTRITGVGKFLRTTSLDELPQMFNVLFGQMSLVGPRPALQFEVMKYNDRQKERLNYKPGLFGVWQEKRNISFEEMINLDIEYGRHQSILFDLTVLFRVLFLSKFR